ncbi:MAG: SDR family oxidoreductase [Bacteroidales bacterium]|nr:SDR family oxidoreductase [Bacteroidales bacterium]
MKTVVITGCNRGLGLTLLDRFAAQQHNIIAITRCPDSSFMDHCHTVAMQNNVDITHHHCDLTDHDALDHMLNDIEASEAEIDILVNNAAINQMKPLAYVDYDDLQTTFQTNYFAPVIITRRMAMLMMRRGSGAIVNITSTGSLGAQPGGTLYDASKAALNQFTRTLGQELASFGIRVNAVACGPIATDMFGQLSDKVQQKLVKSTAMKRAATPDEIADTVLYLASSRATYITGQIIPVDGGSII